MWSPAHCTQQVRTHGEMRYTEWDSFMVGEENITDSITYSFFLAMETLVTSLKFLLVSCFTFYLIVGKVPR